MTARFKLMKSLQPDKREQTGGSLCTACVYHALNIDRTLYEGNGIGNLPEDGCSLDFEPGTENCRAMRTGNCSVRKMKMKRINSKVEGITCSGCAVDIETVLKNTDGISGADASYAAGAVNIDYDPEEINEDQVFDLMKKLGLKIS